MKLFLFVLDVNNKGATTSETAAPALPTEISQKSRDETPVQAVPVSSVTSTIFFKIRAFKIILL